MQLSEIRINNVLGVRAAHIKPTTPITLIAGNNGAGKSSMAEAIRQAMGFDPARVDLKKQFPALVHNGAQSGSVYVEFGGESAVISLPGGEQAISKGLSHDALPYVVNPALFAAQTSDERRTFLLSLMGVNINGKTILSRMKAMGLPDAECDEIAPTLAAGFEAAANAAQAHAREAKGAWRAITGETYGKQKAFGWAAPVVTVNAEAITAIAEQLASLDTEIEQASEAIGRLQGEANAASQQTGEVARLREAAGKLTRAKIKLEHDQSEADRLRGIVAEARQHQHGERYACPCCEAVLILLDGKLSAFEREAGDDTAMEAAADLSRWESSLLTCEAAVKNGLRDVANAEAAAICLKEIDAAPARMHSDALLAGKKADLNDLKDHRRTMQSELTALEEKAREASAAASKTKQATDYHYSVIAWELIVALLSPDGIPAELLNDALTPLNSLLYDVSIQADWPIVRLDNDIAIKVDDRDYRMRSESERWRADAIIAAAIAIQSGLRFILLDRFDVLDADGRSDALYWLDTMAAAEDMQMSALVLGTLKAVPSGLPASIAGYWINSGEVGHA